MFPRRTYARLLLALPLALGIAACDEDGDPVGPNPDEAGTLTVDASSEWAFVTLGETAAPVQVGDARTSSAWDLGFHATAVMLNSGAAGPSNVRGFCVCQNDGASDQQIRAMTAAGELANFEAVTAADLPADEDAWVSDALTPAIDGWWSYDFTTHSVTPVTTNSWIVRGANGNDLFKLRVAGITDAERANAGVVTLEVAGWDGTDYAATRTISLDARAGAVRVDLATGTLNGADWDLWLEGFDLRVNGGVSGSGMAAAVDAGTPFGDTPPANEPPARVFLTDEFGGVFDAHPWYLYDFSNHQIWPNFNVYLIETASGIYKVQLTSYYRPADGEERHITFRYAPLGD